MSNWIVRFNFLLFQVKRITSIGFALALRLQYALRYMLCCWLRLPQQTYYLWTCAHKTSKSVMSCAILCAKTDHLLANGPTGRPIKSVSLPVSQQQLCRVDTTTCAQSATILREHSESVHKFCNIICEFFFVRSYFLLHTKV